MGMLTGKYDDGLPAGSRLAGSEGFRKQVLTRRTSPRSGR
jgi:hypothetical protein